MCGLHGCVAQAVHQCNVLVEEVPLLFLMTEETEIASDAD